MNAAEKWLKFAKDGIRSAEVLLPEGIFNMVCLHSQQAVEKSLKAFLRHRENKVPYIHDLEELCKRCMGLDEGFSEFRQDCKSLDVFYQPTRYPEAPAGTLPEGTPTKEQAEETLRKAEAILEFVEQRIPTS